MKVLIAILSILIMFGCYKELTHELPIECETNNVSNLKYNNEVFALINNYRLVQGLKAIEKDSLCAKELALSHSVYMDSVNKLSHENYNIRSSELISRGANNTAEVGGRGFEFPINLVYAFTQSERHNRVLMGDYTHIGIGKYNEFITILFYN